MLSITNLVRGLLARSATPSRPRRTPRPVRLECLEERALLSGWAIGFGSGNGQAITVDAAGNSYVAGSFDGTADFDPGPGTYNLTATGTSSDIFVAKFSPTGALVWASRAGGGAFDEAYGIAIDSSNNVYVTGLTNGAGDFGSTVLASGGFVAKLNGSGNFLWAVNAGNFGRGIAADSAGNVFIAGSFAGTFDFDPGPGVYNLTSQTADREAFFLKLDTNANFVWVQHAGAHANGGDLAIDASANVYVQGGFWGTVAFGTTTLTSQPSDTQDIFVTKLDSAGNFLWAAREGSPLNDTGCGGSQDDIAVDLSGNAYTTGRFLGSATFGSTTLTSIAGPDVFVAKQDTSGNFVWAKSAGGSGQDCGAGIAVDSSGSVYVSLSSDSPSVDYDPSAGTALLAGGGHLVWKLDSAGNFAWARRTMAGVDSGGLDIALDTSGGVFTTGDNQSGADLDTGSTVVNLNGASPYVLKTTQDVPTTPQLARLSDSPDPAPKNGPLTLTANDIRFIAGGSNVASVSFYRDKNGNGTLEVGTDTLLGTDTNGSNGWSLTTTAASKNGITSYFAQAKDSSNVTGNVVSARNRVGPGGPVASMVSSRDGSAASVDAVIASHYSDNDDREDNLPHREHLDRHTLRELLRARHR